MGRNSINTVGATQDAITLMGSHIETARLRRGWRQQDLARRSGVSLNTIRNVESGAPGTGIAAYAAALWALGLLDQLAEVAQPNRDREGETLAAARLGNRASLTARLDDDF